MFRELDPFPSLGEETTILLGPLERASLNHWTTHASMTTTIYKYLRPGFVEGTKQENIRFKVW
jgi:hypothetical protein